MCFENFTILALKVATVGYLNILFTILPETGPLVTVAHTYILIFFTRLIWSRYPTTIINIMPPPGIEPGIRRVEDECITDGELGAVRR